MDKLWQDAADTWLEMLDHGWYGVVLILITVIPSWLAYRNGRDLKQVKNQTDAVVGQVINGHGDSNLRNDLDRVILAIENLDQYVRLLRKDLMAEEEHRRVKITDLREDLERRTTPRRGSA